MKILLADDSFDTLRMFAMVLRRADHEVVVAGTGKEAWEAFCIAVDGCAPFDLLLLDVAMPKMSGPECAEKIRAFEKEQDMPSTRLIFLSAHMDQIAVENVEHLGIESIEQKPISLDALRALCE